MDPEVADSDVYSLIVSSASTRTFLVNRHSSPTVRAPGPHFAIRTYSPEAGHPLAATLRPSIRRARVYGTSSIQSLRVTRVIRHLRRIIVTVCDRTDSETLYSTAVPLPRPSLPLALAAGSTTQTTKLRPTSSSISTQWPTATAPEGRGNDTFSMSVRVGAGAGDGVRDKTQATYYT